MTAIPHMKEFTKKIFLTGERDVGKSTIIERFVSDLDFVPTGFNTVPGGVSADGNTDHIYIIPFGMLLEELPNTPPVAVRRKIEKGYDSYPEIFDSLGVEILRSSKGARLVVMDELGFMEANALEFQREVFSCLDSDEPVLGVIKPIQTPFLEKIRAHTAVHTIEVTIENRNQVLESLIKDFKSII